MIINNNPNTYSPKSNIKFSGLSNMGNKIPDKVLKFTELEHNGSLNRLAFVSLAFVFLLGARYMQARSQDEKREVATRDFIAVISAVYAVPALEKLIGGYIDKKSKIPAKEAKFEDLEKRFSEKDFSRRKNGLASMLSDIKNQGGDLKTCFDVLGEKAKTSMEELSKKLNLNKKLDNNKDILDLFEKAHTESKTNTEVKEALTKVEKEFGKDNALHKKAKLLKSIPKAACILITAGALGWFIPWFNIHYTKNKYVGKKHDQKAQQPAKIDKTI